MKQLRCGPVNPGPDVRAPCPALGLGVKRFECLRKPDLVAITGTDPLDPWAKGSLPAQVRAPAFIGWQRSRPPNHRDGLHTSTATWR